MKHSTLFELTLLCLFFCIATTPLLQAQFSGPDEVMLYCKDGSKYRGKLIEETDSYTKICIFNNDTILITKDEIRITKRGSNRLYYNKLKTHLTKGFFWSVDLGTSLPNTSPETGNSLSRQFQLLLGWRLNKRVSLAGSVALSAVEYNIGGFWLSKELISFSAYGRYYLTDKRIRPFIYSQIGYGQTYGNNNWPGAPFIHEAKGGLMANNGIGFHFASKKGRRIHLSLGYYIQHTKGNINFLDLLEHEVIIDYKYWIQKPMVKIGFEF